jgi:YVTN family beta-propeller protein
VARPLAPLLTGIFGLAVLLQAAPACAREVLFTEGGTTVNRVVAVDTQTNQVVGSPIPVGTNPHGIAITPDGHRAYVANTVSNTVSVIDMDTKQIVGSPISVGQRPIAIAIAPNGLRAYVTNQQTAENSVSVIDTQTNQTVGSPIPVGANPGSIAITPDSSRAYVANTGSGTVSVIDLQTDQTIGSPISVGMVPAGIVITPDGTRVYVSNAGSDSLSVIDTATNQTVGSPIPTADDPEPLAMAPDGTRVIVGHYDADAVSIIDTGTNEAVGSPIPVAISPAGIAITPDGSRAYATNDDGSITGPAVIDIRTGQATSGAVVLNNFSSGIAIAPNQPPQAAFTQLGTLPGQPVSFDPAGSSDPDGGIARYDWSFGDGTSAPNAGPAPSHVYGLGTFQATLTLTDNEGCSTAFIFTGQTASCSGGPGASASATLVVKPAKPALSRVSQAARRWIEGPGLPRASRRRKLPVGTTFRFTLNEPARVRFGFTQARHGRRVRGKCVPATKRNKRRRACRRTVSVAVLSFNGHGAANRLRFRGRVSRRKKLKPGRYRLIMTARNSARVRSAARHLSFTIVKR